MHEGGATQHDDAAPDLAALAREREARSSAKGPAPASRAEPPPGKPSAARAAAARSRGCPLAVVAALKGAPRSVRLARSAGFALNLLGLCVVLLASWKWGGVLFALGVGLARAGGAWLHGVLPQTLVDGPAPTASEV